MIRDYYTRERHAYLRESAHRHLRIVALFYRLRQTNWSLIIGEGMLWIAAGLMLGDFLRRMG